MLKYTFKIFHSIKETAYIFSNKTNHPKNYFIANIFLSKYTLFVKIIAIRKVNKQTFLLKEFSIYVKCYSWL